MPRPSHPGFVLAAAIAVPLMLSTAAPASAAVSTTQSAAHQAVSRSAADSATAPVSVAVPRCPTAHLRARRLPIGAGAGQRYLPVELTNTGPGTCAIKGWGGFVLLDAHHHRLPTTLTRDGRAAGAHQVILRPGHSVSTVIHFSVVGGTTARDYTHPAYLQITPPNAVHHLTVPFTLQVFHGDLDSAPYTAYH